MFLPHCKHTASALPTQTSYEIFTNCADNTKDYTDNTLSSSTLRIGWLSMTFQSGNYTDDPQKADKKTISSNKDI